jgi:hypothetical protein
MLRTLAEKRHRRRKRQPQMPAASAPCRLESFRRDGSPQRLRRVVVIGPSDAILLPEGVLCAARRRRRYERRRIVVCPESMREAYDPPATRPVSLRRIGVLASPRCPRRPSRSTPFPLPVEGRPELGASIVFRDSSGLSWRPHLARPLQEGPSSEDLKRPRSLLAARSDLTASDSQLPDRRLGGWALHAEHRRETNAGRALGRSGLGVVPDGAGLD